MYSVYKTINTINGKHYIGVHKTSDPHDSYLGSGRAIKAAIKKHGRENFRKQILFLTEDEDEAYALERTLTQDFTSSDNYNMRQGGIGGFTRENARKGLISRCAKGGRTAVQSKVGVHAFSSEMHSENGSKGGVANRGKPKSEEHKQKIREALLRRNRPVA